MVGRWWWGRDTDTDTATSINNVWGPGIREKNTERSIVIDDRCHGCYRCHGCHGCHGCYKYPRLHPKDALFFPLCIGPQLDVTRVALMLFCRNKNVPSITITLCCHLVAKIEFVTIQWGNYFEGNLSQHYMYP